MLFINFEGWFQCRLASDPDPTDEPRGVSGCTFALVGEPDFDRIIRLQKPDDSLVRTHSPTIGVQVSSIAIDGESEPAHPLVGAKIELLNDAKFQEQNSIVVERDHSVIDPFDFQIAQGDELVLCRQTLWDVKNPNLSLYDASPELLKVRQPILLEMNSPEVLMTAGIVDPVVYRDRRIAVLKKERSEDKITNDPVRKAGLDQRIEALELKDWRGQRLLLLLGAKVLYNFELNGPTKVIDNQSVLKGNISTCKNWRIEFWMGAWDNDALCGYMKGTLLIPS